jgi:glycosyltransferase involved in cell wall biosynthesis
LSSIGLVSICIPAYNSADTVTTAVRSALEQDYGNIEVVVTDDASTDGTADLLRAFGDRIRLSRNRRRLGQNHTANASISGSSGEFVKFLHDDDRLEPHCVSRMVDALAEHPSAGMVFSPRRIELHHGSPEERVWLAEQSKPREFRALNPGSQLFEEMLAGGFKENWIGEPVCVMVRRGCLSQLGGFHNYVRQTIDLDLWARIAAHYDLAYVDEELAVYRHSEDSLGAFNRKNRLGWVDPLWTLEALATFPGLLSRYPIRERLRRERRIVERSVAKHFVLPGYRAPSTRAWWAYAAWRLLRGRLVGEVS